MSRRRAPLAVTALLALMAVWLTACRGDTPDEFARAVEDLRDGPLAFEAGVSGGDRPVGVETGGLLTAATLHGTRDDDGVLHVRYEIGGDAPLFEIRVDPGELPLLRMGMADLLGVPSDADPEADLGPLLDARGITGAGRQALLAGFRGEWIELEDGVDGIGGLTGGAAEGADPDGGQDLLESLVAATETQPATAADRVDLLVDMAAVRSALSATLGTPLLGPGVPEIAPGSAILAADGALREVRVDVTDGDGPAELRIRFHPAPDGPLPRRPDPVARVTNRQLAELGDLLGAA